MRKIKFRLIKDDRIVGYEAHCKLSGGTIVILHSVHGNWAESGCYNITIYPERYILHDYKEQCIGIKGKNCKEAYDGDLITFLLAFPTSQTHTGDNIPNGSYTEPDEPFFHKITAQIIWDDERAMWSWSIVSKIPYGFEQMPIWYGNGDTLPILNRETYSMEYLKSLCGKCDESNCNRSNCEFLENSDVEKFEDLGKIMNTFEIIGTIHTETEQK